MPSTLPVESWIEPSMSMPLLHMLEIQQGDAGGNKRCKTIVFIEFLNGTPFIMKTIVFNFIWFLKNSWAMEETRQKIVPNFNGVGKILKNMYLL